MISNCEGRQGRSASFQLEKEKDRRVEVEAAPAGDEGEEGEAIEVVQEDQWVLPDDRLVFDNFIVGGFCRLHDLKFIISPLGKMPTSLTHQGRRLSVVTHSWARGWF